MLIVLLLCEFPEEGLQRKPVDPGHLFQGLKGGEVASRAGHAVAQKHPDRLRPPSEEGLHDLVLAYLHVVSSPADSPDLVFALAQMRCPEEGTGSTIEDVEILARCPVFQGLAPEELRHIRASARPKELRRGEVLFSQGDPAKYAYVVESGQMRLVQVLSDGREVIYRILTPGEFFGGIASLGEARYPVSAEALEDSVVLGWSGEAMRRLLLRHPRVALNLLRLQARRIEELQERVQELSSERVERRVARAVLRLARQAGRRTEEGILVDLPLRREDLASLTGTTLFTTSRILSQWERQGIVSAGRQRLVIRIPHALVEIAEDLSLTEDKEPSGGSG
jgi:CRP-like cAMP-binding protein